MSDQQELEQARTQRDQAQKAIEDAADEEDRDYWRRVRHMWDIRVRRLEADAARRAQERAE